MSLEETFFLVGGMLLAHVALYFLSLRVNPLYVLVSGYMILAPYTATFSFKLVRGYVLVALLVVGWFLRPRPPLGGASKAWLVFWLLYAVVTARSDYSPSSLFTRSLCILVLLSGLYLAYGLRSVRDLLVGLRYLTVGACAIGSIVLFTYGKDPRLSVSTVGRAAFQGADSAYLASVLLPLIVIAMFLALNDPLIRWRIVASVTSVFLVTVVIIASSRGVLLSAAIGAAIQLVPAARRSPRTMLGILLVTGAVGLMLIFVQPTEEAVKHLLSSDLSGREMLWQESMDMFRERPIFGHGNQDYFFAHNLFLQVVVESGMVGVSLLTVCAVIIATRVAASARRMSAYSATAPWITLPLSLMVTGVAEAMAGVAMTLPSPIALGFAYGCGLIDALPALLIQSQGIRHTRYLPNMTESPVP